MHRKTPLTLAAMVFFGASTTLVGCSFRSPLPAVSMIEAAGFETTIREGSALDGPYRIDFEWSLTEPGARLNGIGVARVEPPYHARLDLFLSNSERVASAALVDDEMRVLVSGRTELPPPPLLWGSLGVFRPGDGAILDRGARDRDGRTELVYRSNNQRVRYRMDMDRIESVDVLRNERVYEELRLVNGPDRFPTRAVYRDLEEVRELTITVDRVEASDPFPVEIWGPF